MSGDGLWSSSGTLWSGTRAPEVLDALIDSAPVGIGFWSSDLRYLRINEALARLNGASLDEHVGRTPAEVMGEMGERVMDALREAIDSRRPVVEVELTGRVRGHGEQVQHREGSWFPVFDELGELVGVGGVVRDVTDRHEMVAEQSRLLQDAITARAHSEAAQVRSASMHEEAERARREAERAERAAQLAQDRMRFLMEAGSRIRATLEVDDALRALAAVAVPVLADWGYITTVSADGALITHAARHANPDRAEQALELLERHPPRRGDAAGAGRVITTGTPEMVSELDDHLLHTLAEDEEHLQMLRAAHVRSSLVLPLRVGTRTLGALTLQMVDSGRRFTDDYLALARALADQAALHIRNAQLYTERAHIARTLQAGLLPRRLPRIPGLEIGARYHAAGWEAEVGGDFYDAFHAEDEHWTVLLGDVSGKGAEAAAVTSLARHTLRTAALHAASPARNLATLNRALIAEADTTRFCTVLCMRISPRDDHAVVTMANGGHLAPRILRADGRVERLEISGTLVGAIADARFDEARIRLDAGDVMLMFTDGVSEIRIPGRGGDYGEREIDRHLASLAGAGAAEIARAIEQRALDMHDGQPRDDMAIVALRVTGR